MKPVTIKDLSKHLLLSTSTISRALVNDKNIRTETREKVLMAAQELGYRPNPSAVNLKYGRSNCIGVIVPEMVTPFASQVLEGIQAFLYPKGYQVIIAQSDEDPERERKNLKMMQQFRVDGIIISLCHQTYNQELYQELQQEGIAMVFYDRVPAKLDVSKVIVNDYVKSSFMVEHLIRSGRKHIAHFQAPACIYNAVERARGYRDTLSKFKIPYNPALVIPTGLTFDEGRRAVEKLLTAQTSFDSIFAFTDTLAIGAMNCLHERNIKIPDQVAIASFSGTKLSTLVNPQLTTVEQPLDKMGRVAAEMMLDKLVDKSYRDKTVVLDAEIKLRASTGRAFTQQEALSDF